MMEKKSRKSLGKVTVLDKNSLKKMFDEKPGEAGILVGVMAKYAEGLNFAGAGAKITEDMIKDVMFIGEVIEVNETSFHIRQYRNISVGEQKMYRDYIFLLDFVTLVLPTVEQFIAMSNQIVYVEGGEAYVDETQYAGVYCVIGKRHTKTEAGEVVDDELNGIFCKREDAERMGEMLVSYGELNGISYSSFEIREMLVL